jgi:type III secretory pathway component EscU
MKRSMGVWLLSIGLLLMFFGAHASMVAVPQAGILGRMPLVMTQLVSLLGAAAAILGLGFVAAPPPEPHR